MTSSSDRLPQAPTGINNNWITGLPLEPVMGTGFGPSGKQQTGVDTRQQAQQVQQQTMGAFGYGADIMGQQWAWKHSNSSVSEEGIKRGQEQLIGNSYLATLYTEADRGTCACIVYSQLWQVAKSLLYGIYIQLNISYGIWLGSPKICTRGRNCGKQYNNWDSGISRLWCRICNKLAWSLWTASGMAFDTILTVALTCTTLVQELKNLIIITTVNTNLITTLLSLAQLITEAVIQPQIP
ncbi:hypothetical protein BT96DRAFT_939181 [Gymnopus androsaceus JB14]|uniref:Uncharacterized protein n=1 Tax=Gymnopus androsaceus JB14 TaxID=1447944 RepID=A0A6A4HMQ8_9AGAR|nr:hypothetical protein BT96DRAFT_939181 [Gymnopus androsaceus JB14]